MKLLIHICCANCYLYPFQSLFSKGFEVKGLWFNPNIHPYTEYKMRLDALHKLQNLWKLDIEYVDHYGLKEFIRAVVKREEYGERCFLCYSMRLEETAKNAKRMGLDGFTTTLLVSPYQKFDIILNIGNEIAKKHSIQFYKEDFRTGWNKGMKLSKELGLYRQKYCGCIYSEMERYLNRKSDEKEIK